MATAKTPNKTPAPAKPAASAVKGASPAAKPAAPAVKAAAPAVKAAAPAVKAPAPAVKAAVPPVKASAPEAKPAVAAVKAPAVKAAAPAAKPEPASVAEAKPAQDAVVKKPVARVAEPVIETVGAAAPAPVAEAVTKAAEVTAEIADKPAKVAAVAKKAAQETSDRMVESMTPLLDYSRDSAILMIAAGNQLALGLQKLSLSLIDWSAESCDKGVAASQAILAAKTVEEVVDLSRSLARDGLDQFLKESAELSSLSTRLIEDTIVPLPARLAAVAEKLASRAA